MRQPSRYNHGVASPETSQERKRRLDRERQQRYRDRNRDAYNARQRRWRAANPERKRELSRAYQRRVAAVISETKQGEPCADCKRADLPPWALHFHHVTGQKRFNIGRWYEAAAWKPRRRKDETLTSAVEAEILKCIILCPTCHALRHPPTT